MWLWSLCEPNGFDAILTVSSIFHPFFPSSVFTLFFISQQLFSFNIGTLYTLCISLLFFNRHIECVSFALFSFHPYRTKTLFLLNSMTSTTKTTTTMTTTLLILQLLCQNENILESWISDFELVFVSSNLIRDFVLILLYYMPMLNAHAQCTVFSFAVCLLLRSFRSMM